MTDMTDRVDVSADALLAHGGWMRALALRLVSDPERADDVVQQSFVVALERPPRHAGDFAAWLRRVVVHRASELGRSEKRRAWRERAATRAEALPSTATLVMEAELQREVVSALLKLAEPYRSTVLLRFYRDLSPKEIAERQGIPAATVRSRLKRALAEVRDELDRRHGGDRRVWGATLVPLARAGAVAVLSIKVKIAIVAGVAALVAALITVQRTPQAPVPAAPPVASADDESPDQSPETVEVAALTAPAAADGRTPLDVAASPAPTADAVADAGPTAPDAKNEAFGRVLDDETGDPIAGARVSSVASQVTTGLDGRYRLSVQTVSATAQMFVAADAYAPRAEYFVIASREPVERDFRLVRGAALRLSVFDVATGEAIAGAKITRSHQWDVGETDAEGAFTVRFVAGERVALLVRRPGYAVFDWRFEAKDLKGLESPRIPMQEYGWIDGTIRDEAGDPLVGAVLTVMQQRRLSGSSIPMLEADLRELGLPGTVLYMHHRGSDKVSDKAGNFSLRTIPSELPYIVVGGVDGLVPVRIPSVRVAEPGQHVQIQIVQRKGIQISGRVLYNGNALWHGLVTCRSVDGSTYSSRLDPEGRYLIRSVPAGEVVLRFNAQSSQHANPEPVTLTIVSEREVEHDFSWEEERSSISGFVVDVSGQPLADQPVRARRDGVDGRISSVDTQTADDGSFLLDVLPGAPYTVEIWSEPATDRRDDVLPGAEGIELVLPDVGFVRLRLTDDESGEMLTSFGFTWAPISWRVTATDAFCVVPQPKMVEGVFGIQVPIASPGATVDLAINLSREGYLPQRAMGLSVARTLDEAPVVEVRLERGLDCTLTITGDEVLTRERRKGLRLFILHDDQLASVHGPFPSLDGSASRSLDIMEWVGDAGVLMQQTLSPGATGVATLRGLQPGRYTIMCYPDNIRFEPETFELSVEAAEIEIWWSDR